MVYFVHLEQHSTKFNTSKFYRLAAQGSNLYSFWGRVGGKGQSKVQACSGDLAAVHRLVTTESSKVSGGYYHEVKGDLPTIPDLGTPSGIDALEKLVQMSGRQTRGRQALSALAAPSDDLALLRVDQWDEWAKAWEWRQEAAQALLGYAHSFSKEKNVLLLEAPSNLTRALAQADARSHDLGSIGEPTDESVLETALSLWEPDNRGSALISLEDAYLSASLI